MTLDSFHEYLNTIAKTRAATAGAGTHDLEHQHRPAMGALLHTLLPGVAAVNEPGKIDFGAPDFALLKERLPIGYVETKRLGEDLDEIAKGEQLKRYFGYANLILTNYLEFRFYKHGEIYCEPITIAPHDSLILDATACTLLETTIKAFLEDAVEPVRRASRLAVIMGESAKRLRGNLLRFLKSVDNAKNKPILDIYDAFKQQLIRDLSIEDFADMYAQTLVYGLFAARYHDETSSDFSRAEARELIPHTNPLLRRFFDHIAGADFDDRLKPIVDELCKVFSATDVRTLMQQIYKQDLWGDEHAAPDPVIHFYEDFLKEYDPTERKKLGAYYTPPSVVHFIVRSIDEILKRDFNLQSGLADTERINVTREIHGKKTKTAIHRVQILDPATGTGTFLNETIRLIRRSFAGQEGRFGSYVSEDLLPRLHGFELMMAPYTIAHLKLVATFRESGAKNLNDRIGVYLTNSLEKADRPDDTLFASLGLSQSISEEGRAAARIKNDTPIMVVMGNPPYSGVSSNETEYANSLVEKYKSEPGGKQKLQERKHWLNDDYVKFIALAEDMVAKTGYGVVGMITNNGYLDNPTFRGMRWHLAKTFDQIYVLDLHGNAKKKESAPDGSRDQNVFDIMQGVGIILAVKTGKKRANKLAEVYHADLYGKREVKSDVLMSGSINFQPLSLDDKSVYFVPKNTKGQGEYEKGFQLNELFQSNTTGIVTMGDSFIIDESKDVIAERVQKLARGEYSESMLNHEFGLGKNYAKFVLEHAAGLLFDLDKVVQLNYRPFDSRWTYFDNKVVWRWRESVMKHYQKENIGLLFSRMTKGKDFAHVSVTSRMSEVIYLSPLTGTNAFNAPLYLYADDGTRISNLNRDIVKQISTSIGQESSPEEIFDYVYAVLHSPNYREKYNEFLKTDFPRVPYPKGKPSFDVLAGLGKELRELHLLESPKVRQLSTTYPEDGENKIEKIRREGDKVCINEKQYFGNVPETAWLFFIGGYQPAQKWLKDRVGRTLTSADIEHYQQMIVALKETDRIMKEIDKYDV